MTWRLPPRLKEKICFMKVMITLIKKRHNKRTIVVFKSVVRDNDICYYSKKIPEKVLVKMIPSEDNHFFANLDNKQEEEGCNSSTVSVKVFSNWETKMAKISKGKQAEGENSFFLDHRSQTRVTFTETKHIIINSLKTLKWYGWVSPLLSSFKKALEVSSITL